MSIVAFDKFVNSQASNMLKRSCFIFIWTFYNNNSAESEGLRFDSSRGLRIFSLSHARDKTKNIFLNNKLLSALCKVSVIF